MSAPSTILQILPRLPGERDGVGDYAVIVARKMCELYSHETAFATADSALNGQEIDHVILHYVNYGYQKRGVPFGLLSILRKLRSRCRGRLVTIFHELSASGPPWKSAFWLRPFQTSIVRSIAQLSDACIVSNETMRDQLRAAAPDAHIRVHPVVSNFGEPLLRPDEISNRFTHRWVICGGTVLVERCLRSFASIVSRPRQNFSVHELVVLGGDDNLAVRSILAGIPNIHTQYCPQIDAAEASKVLSECSFAWFDYFHRSDVPADVALKSGTFAAICAHAIIPVFPHAVSEIAIAGDVLPTNWFVSEERVELPHDRRETAAQIHQWYQRRAAARHLARGISEVLNLNS